MRDGAEGRADACLQKDEECLGQQRHSEEGDDAHGQQRKLDLKSEPFFRTPKLLWVSGRLRRRRGWGRVLAV